MKKALIAWGIGLFFPILIIGFFIVGFAGGDIGSVSSSVSVFASEEEAYAYQYIGSELGVPWDIVLLTDGIHAQENGLSGIESYNPLKTSLQFCILLEDKWVAVTKEVEVEEELDSSDNSENIEDSEADNDKSESVGDSIVDIVGGIKDSMDGIGELVGNIKDSIENPDSITEDTESTTEIPNEETITEPVIEWVLESSKYYTGQEQILNYIHKNADELDYEDVSSIVADINEKAEEKSTDDVRYEITILINPDYEEVLEKFIGLSPENIEKVMELYESNYMAAMYGYSSDYSNIVLPNIVQGNVSRMELAQVASSLINHPYHLGGKSSQVGPPVGPLDCSGFVDWVYVQCFGVPVSNGTIPEGIAVSGTAMQFYACEAISQQELKVGDLGFVNDPANLKDGQINHVGIYIGSHNGKQYWIHCGGRSYGTEESANGRVGISINTGYNNYNPVTGSEFSPSMKSCRFRYFRRPQFQFTDD